MVEITISIPEELESEFKVIPKIELSILISKLLKEKLSKLVRLRQIVSRSKLKEEDAKELADEISLSLAKRYKELSSK